LHSIFTGLSFVLTLSGIKTLLFIEYDLLNKVENWLGLTVLVLIELLTEFNNEDILIYILFIIIVIYI